MKTPWAHKPAYVEWQRTGTAADGYGAIIFRSAAPMVTVHEIPQVYRTDEEIAAAVEGWVASEHERFRLNEAFERFPAIARSFEDEGDDSRGYWA